MTTTILDVSKEDQIGDNSNKLKKKFFFEYLNKYLPKKYCSYQFLTIVIGFRNDSPLKRIRTMKGENGRFQV